MPYLDKRLAAFLDLVRDDTKYAMAHVFVLPAPDQEFYLATTDTFRIHVIHSRHVFFDPALHAHLQPGAYRMACAAQGITLTLNPELRCPSILEKIERVATGKRLPMEQWPNINRTAAKALAEQCVYAHFDHVSRHTLRFACFAHAGFQKDRLKLNPCFVYDALTLPRPRVSMPLQIRLLDHEQPVRIGDDHAFAVIAPIQPQRRVTASGQSYKEPAHV